MTQRTTITIHDDGAAFEDAPATETARILRLLADQIEHDGIWPEQLFDINGNTCGYVKTETCRVTR
tara:strand:- start:626 stop:823 length:198 start_codon:yes stop_codon:yes gene_type:complete